jgi:hypothetical protein
MKEAAVAWDTIENRQMINAFSLGFTGSPGLIGAVTLCVGGVGRDEYHVSFGHRTHARDRTAESIRCPAPRMFSFNSYWKH